MAPDRAGGLARAPGRAPRASGSGRCPARGRARARRTSGRSPDRTSASMVLEWALRWTTTSPPACASVSSATWLPCDAPLIRNQLRAGRPTPAAASACACSNGVGSGPVSMPQRQRRDVERERALADRLAQRRVGARPALVPGHVEAAGIARRVGAQGVEVGRLSACGRARRHRRASARRRSEGRRAPRPRPPGEARRRHRRPAISQLSSPTTGLPALRASAISDSVP